jgi:hypothetical protein
MVMPNEQFQALYTSLMITPPLPADYSQSQPNWHARRGSPTPFRLVINAFRRLLHRRLDP